MSEPESLVPSPQSPDRNLALELVRVTEAAAMAAARWVGRGDKNGADAVAVNAMRVMISTIGMDGDRGDRRGREGQRPDALQRRAGRRRHRPRVRRRGRPDRRHHADRQGDEQRGRGAGGLAARLDVRPVRGVLHGEAGHRARGRRGRRHPLPGGREHPPGRQGQGHQPLRRHRGRCSTGRATRSWPRRSGPPARGSSSSSTATSPARSRRPAPAAASTCCSASAARRRGSSPPAR